MNGPGQVTCPRCGAMPGLVCLAEGLRLPYFHMERKAAAREEFA